MADAQKLLSIDDVNQRLPLVRSIVRDIVGLSADLAQRQDRLKDLRKRYPATRAPESVYEQEVLSMEDELRRDESRFEELTNELAQVGAILTDPVTGTVDFPGVFDGDPVRFCWKNGETELLYWHGEECSSSTRKKLLQLSGLTEQST